MGGRMNLMLRRRAMMSSGPKEQPNYLCFTALESGTFTFTIGTYLNPNAGGRYNIEYSIDGGTSWVHTDNVANQQIVVTTPTIQEGDTVLWRGNATSNNSDTKFSSTGRYDVSGLLSSIYNGRSCSEDDETKANNYATSLFNGSVGLVNADELILSKMNASHTFVYANMFEACTGLESAAFEISGNTNTNDCNKMFYQCRALVTPPTFNITSLAGSKVFMQMFDTCPSLMTIPSFNFDSLVSGCYWGMFAATSSFTGSVDLPSLVVPANGYRNMFQNSKITYVRMLATDISASSCVQNMLGGVPNVSTSILVKNINATWTTAVAPSNWTILYYDPATDKYYLSDKATECDDHGNPI